MAIPLPSILKQSYAHDEACALLSRTGLVWVYGSDGFLLQRISEMHATGYEQVFWLQAGQTGSQLIQACNEMGHELEPSWRKTPPRNYLETLITRIQTIKDRCLFVILNFKPQHFSTVKKITQIVGENRHLMITSGRRFHETSIYCQLSNSPPTDKIPASTLSDFEILSGLNKEGRFDEWRKSGLSPFSFLCTVYPYLCLLNGCTISSDFTTTHLKLDLETLKSYGIIRRMSDESVEFYSVGNPDVDSIQEIAPTVIPLLRKITPSRLQPQDQWIIHFTQKLCEHLPDDFFQSHQELTLCFSSLLLQMGHFCTQIGNISLARELTIQARSVIETSFKLKEKEKKGKQDRISEDFGKLYMSGPKGALLVYIYAQIQYQAGRLSFYSKEPDEKLGSKGLLQYAEGLMDQLEKEKDEKFLLTCLIARNGLFFHLMEEGKYQEAIIGYRKLLEMDRALEANFYEENWTQLELDKDPLFQINCLRYIIASSAKVGKVQPADILELKKHLKNIKPEERISASIALVEGYIEEKNIGAAEVELELLRSQIIPPHYQLSFLEAQLKFFILKGDVEATRAIAQKYREEASQHYSKGAPEVCTFLLYENLADPTQLAKISPFPFEDIERKIQTLLNTVPTHYIYETPILKITVSKKSKAPAIPWQIDQTINLPLNELNAFLNFIPSPTVAAEEVQEEVDGSQTKLKVGTCQLTLGSRMVRKIKDDGNWEKLKIALKEGPDSFANSPFGVTAGYRLSLDNTDDDEALSHESKGICSAFAEELGSSLDPGLRSHKVTTNDWRQFAQLCVKQLSTTSKDTQDIDRRVGELYEEIQKLQRQKEALQEKYPVDPKTVKSMLHETASAILTLPIVQEAKPLIVSKEKDIKEVASKIHFQSPSTFIYHVFKHSKGEFFGPMGFNIEQFNKSCHSYLTTARRTVQTPDMTSEFPDQCSDVTTNYRYYTIGQSVQRLWSAQQEWFEAKERSDRLEAWKENLSYQPKRSGNDCQPFLARCAEEARILKEKATDLATLEGKLANTPADTAIVTSIRQGDGIYEVFFRTMIHGRKLNLQIADINVVV